MTVRISGRPHIPGSTFSSHVWRDRKRGDEKLRVDNVVTIHRLVVGPNGMKIIGDTSERTFTPKLDPNKYEPVEDWPAGLPSGRFLVYGSTDYETPDSERKEPDLTMVLITELVTQKALAGTVAKAPAGKTYEAIVQREINIVLGEILRNAGCPCPHLPEIYNARLIEYREQIALQTFYSDCAQEKIFWPLSSSNTPLLEEPSVAYIAHAFLQVLKLFHEKRHLPDKDPQKNQLLMRELHRAIQPSHMGVTPDGTIQLFNGECDRTYMAPERLLKQPYKASADIWSLGVTIADLLFRGIGKEEDRYPFGPFGDEMKKAWDKMRAEESPLKALNAESLASAQEEATSHPPAAESLAPTQEAATSNPPAPTANSSPPEQEDLSSPEKLLSPQEKIRRAPFSEEAKDFIGRCCKFDASLRSTAEDLLTHPWIKMHAPSFSKQQALFATRRAQIDKAST